MIARLIDAWRLHRLFSKRPTELESWWAEREASMAARKAAREAGQTYVAGHVRRVR